jgi:hypothetical protein
MSTPGMKIDCEFAQLRTGGYTGSLMEMELAWLQNNGATSKDLGDAWMEFLTAQGFTTGSRIDRELAYYLSLAMPADGNSLQDQRREFWCGGHNPP